LGAADFSGEQDKLGEDFHKSKEEVFGVTGFFWGVAGEVVVLDFNPRLWTTSC
jgi:hypothetical protein